MASPTSPEALVAERYWSALARLVLFLGPDEADEAFFQATQLARLAGPPETADELYRLAVMLCEVYPETGSVAAVGRALRVSAVLLGAEPVKPVK